MSAIQMMEADQKYRRYVKLMDESDQFNSVDAASIDALIEDTQNWMVANGAYATMRLLGQTDFIMKMVELNMTQQNYRSKLSQQLVLLHKVHANCRTAISAIEQHLLVTYRRAMRDEGYSQVDCPLVVKQLTQEDHTWCDKLKSLVQSCEIVIADIDKAHFSLKEAKDAYAFLVRGGEKVL